VTYLVSRGSEDLATCATEEEALAVVRRELPSLAPQAIALSGLEVAKLDRRGPVRHSWNSRQLAARVLGQPLESLGPWHEGPNRTSRPHCVSAVTSRWP
jgi:hypothetical protein